MDGVEELARTGPENAISGEHEQLVAEQVDHAIAKDKHVKV